MVMKKDRIIITNKARASLRSYFEYLKVEVSLETAQHVRDEILSKCAKLKDFSGYSKEKYLEDEPEEYRSITLWHYNIIYTVTEQEVRVLNIIHTSRNPEKRKDL